MRVIDVNNQEAFENECFRDWLNLVDARMGYENRRQIPVSTWRECFDYGYSIGEAVIMSETNFADMHGL